MISLVDLKSWLGVTGTADDMLLVDLEKRAVVWIERQTDRYFGPPAATTETISGRGTGTVYLKELPAASPAPVVDLDLGSGYTVVPLADYTLDQGAVYHDTYWPFGRRNIRVTYTRGYAPGTEPGDIKQLVLDVVALLYRRAKRKADGLQSETIGDYSYTLGADKGEDPLMSIPTAEATLDAWRRVHV